MAKAVDFHSLRRWRGHATTRFEGIFPSICYKLARLYPFAMVFLLLGSGCTPIHETVRLKDPPLKPLAGTEQSTDMAKRGREGASLQFTSEGREHLRSGRLEQAMSKFQKAISLSSANPYAYYYFGETRYLKEEHQQSLSLLERAELLLLSDPIWLSRVYVLRGKNYEALSRYEEAKGQFQQALAKDPNNVEAQESMDRLQHLLKLLQ